ncbi:type 2 periplasmic-binding domain-containing protein [Paenibacillus hexagrammi]|uniref:Extracellular solute-binding protein n=1 Tax=Paenibacillus hexagrammi TaxID=2908839 RepID=A0ABY3SFP1_9BACL|nr:hypothetical protein [Paenibacillus sp. YPD9-1]UJF32843.1 hypothetical protein L0M14_25235 [Paenibacillus sp. YPD9-1]
MLNLPAWGEQKLQEWVPEQKGKWRVTRPPFGIIGNDMDSSNSIALTSQSKQKETAWLFIQYVCEQSGTMNWYINPKPSEFLGGQNAQELYRTLTGLGSSGMPTPLDRKASEIWNRSIDEIINKNTSAEDSLSLLYQDIMDEVSIPYQQLLNYKK